MIGLEECREDAHSHEDLHKTAEKDVINMDTGIVQLTGRLTMYSIKIISPDER
jgi:hypothetical protein